MRLVLRHSRLPGLVAVYHRAITLLAALAALLFIVMTAGIGAEAIFRSLKLGLVFGIVDFSEHAMYCIALLPAPWILAQNGHISVNLLTQKLPAAVARVVAMLADLICLAVCLTVAFYGADILWQSWQRGEVIFSELIVPEWWLQWQAPMVFLLLSVEFALRLARGGSASLSNAPLRDLS